MGVGIEMWVFIYTREEMGDEENYKITFCLVFYRFLRGTW